MQPTHPPDEPRRGPGRPPNPKPNPSPSLSPLDPHPSDPVVLTEEQWEGILTQISTLETMLAAVSEDLFQTKKTLQLSLSSQQDMSVRLEGITRHYSNHLTHNHQASPYTPARKG